MLFRSNAIIQNEPAIVTVDVSFAGMELFVPKEWNVSNEIHTAFGGVEEKHKQPSPNGKRLIVNGNVNFAGVTIRYI